jgi:poly(ADP-ribose) glycohydrolase
VLSGFVVNNAKGASIESDGLSCLQIDFANKFIGGGVLGRGCVQEEIRFMINTECLVSLLVTTVMRDHESITIVGTEQISNYTGYGKSFAYSGRHIDRTPSDRYNRIGTVVCSINALYLIIRAANRCICAYRLGFL